MTRCKHENADHLIRGDLYNDAAEACFGPFEAKCEQLRCLDCGEWLSIDPANDAAPEVQIEIRAALLAADDTSVAEFLDHEWLGWNQDEPYICAGLLVDIWAELTDPKLGRWHAGWLAREIATHTETT